MFKILHLMSDLSLFSMCRSCGAYMLDALSSGAHVGDTGLNLFFLFIFNSLLSFLSKPKYDKIIFYVSLTLLMILTG